MLKEMELGSWTIFSLLDKEFTAQIRLACVFGNLGNEALIVTRDDEVYALGSNGAGCLGQSQSDLNSIELLVGRIIFINSQVEINFS